MTTPVKARVREELRRCESAKRPSARFHKRSHLERAGRRADESEKAKRKGVAVESEEMTGGP